MNTLPNKVVFKKEEYEKLLKEIDKLKNENRRLRNLICNFERIPKLLSEQKVFMNIPDNKKITECYIMEDHVSQSLRISFD